MTALIKVLESPLNAHNGDEINVDAGHTIDQTLSKASRTYQGPTKTVLCYLNGHEVKSGEWKSKIIEKGDVIMLCPRVHGFDPFTIAIIISIALAVVAYSLISVPTVDVGDTLPEQSPTYDIDARGNKARLNKPIPARYGRHRIYPDFASSPYREFIGDDQYLYQLFAIGQGEYEYEALKIGDTPIANFDEVEYAFYSPGQKITLFRDAVNVSPDVTNATLYAPNEADYSGWTGPFIANDVDTVAEELAIDLVIPKGLYYANDDGGLDQRSVVVQFEYQDVDEYGTGVGSWTLFKHQTYTNATVDAIRRTLKGAITTTTGRVQVRGKRNNNTVNDYKQSDEIRWVGLKAYLESNQTYNHSTWAVKARATDNLSNQNERLFNLVATRKLPIWDGTQWLPEQATRSIAWAYCDALKAEYGGLYTDKNLPLAKLKTLDDLWASRGDYFDGQFDTKITLWEALKKICLVGRAYPYQYGDQFDIIRDGPTPANVYMFNGRNILSGSMNVTYHTPDEYADDSVEVKYVDPNTWEEDPIIAAVPGSPAERPKQVSLFGCTNRMQAHREAMFMAAVQYYRNISADFKTELDGRVLDYLDGAIVSQDMSKWGKGGEIVAVDGNKITLSEPVDFELTGSHQILFRQDDGVASEPFECTSEANRNEVTVLGTLPEYLYTGDDKEKTYYTFSSPVSIPRSMLVQNVQSSGDMEVQISTVLDNPIVHTFDELINNGTIVTTPAVEAKEEPIFAITNLIVVQTGTVTDPKLMLSWSPAAKALRYLVDVSYDEGATWSRAATVATNGVTISVLPGTVDVRIAPQNDEIGQWFQRQVEVGSEFAKPEPPTGLVLKTPFVGTSATVEWSDQPTAAAWFVEVSDLIGEVKYSENSNKTEFSFTYAQAATYGIGREFDITVYSVNGNGVLSDTGTTLRVKNNQVQKITGVTIRSIVDQLVIEWQQPTEADFDHIRLYASQTEGFIPGTSNLIEPNIRSLIYSLPVVYGERWYIRLAGVDVWGEDELIFSDEVNAKSSEVVATVIHDDFIETPMLKANAVTAEKITVPNLSAISAVLGTVTSGIFKTTSTLGYRVEVSSEGDYPIWYGVGAKDAANGVFYVDKNGNMVAKGITIYNDSGDVVLSSGGNISSSNIVGLGDIASIDQITAANISTYMGPAAIKNAYIGDAEVDTLKIAGQSIILSEGAYSSSTTAIGLGYTTVLSKTINIPDVVDGSVLIIQFKSATMARAPNYYSSLTASWRILVNGVQVLVESFVVASNLVDNSGNTNAIPGMMVLNFPYALTYSGDFTVTIQSLASNSGNYDARYKSMVLTAGKR